MNYFNQVIDFLDEKNPKDLSIDYSAPKKDTDYGLIIKTASGDIAKKFPLNNATNCAFSYASYLHNRDNLNESMQKIAEAKLASRLDLYAIEHNLSCDPEIKTNIYVLSPEDRKAEKVADSDIPQEFACHIDEVGYYPIDNVDFLLKSSQEFIKNASNLSVKDRKETAFNMIKKASDLGIQLPVVIQQYSSFTPNKLKSIKMAMATKMLNYPTNFKNFFNDLVDRTKTAEDFMKVASMVEKADDVLKIKKNRHLDPSIFFFTTEKTAEEKSVDKISEYLDKELLNDYFDKDTVELIESDKRNNYANLSPKLKETILKLNA